MEPFTEDRPANGKRVRHRPALIDVVPFVALATLAASPWLPARSAVLAAIGLVAAASSLVPIGADTVHARLARAVSGGLCLTAAIPWIPVWPVYLLAPILCGAGLALVAGFGQGLRDATALGRMGRFEWIAVALVAGVATALLLAWFRLAAPDLSRFRAQVPPWPGAALLLAGLGFAAANAVLEEVIWRGILQRWLGTILPPTMAVGVQAASFGASHYYGIPSGFAGVALATGYGVLLGALRVRSGGLAAPIAAHIAADATIFAILLRQIG